MSELENSQIPRAVAIVGMAGRFPQASSVEEFWRNLREGKECITEFSDDELAASGASPELIANPAYVRSGFALANPDLFDANFFGYTPREAECMDPQRRLFLESAWEALEDAGYDPNKYEGLIGIYAGCGYNNYLLRNLVFNPRFMESLGHFQIVVGNDKDFLTTCVSYKLNLKGPSLAIQTACSTSLVTVQMACQGLLSYQCDMALAGGVSIQAPRVKGYLYSEGEIISPDGHCRAFDAKAQGTAFGEGVGVVVLKRLEDALADRDSIYAMVRGAAINNDGSGKIGYTAPSVDGQAAVVAMALAMADVDPETIGFIEAHGTGTPLGDPIEIAALTQVFRAQTGKKQFCAIGSAKTNIGHLDAAAGIAGLIKTALVLKHKEIPPTLYFESPNPGLDLGNSPFYVNTSLAPWPRGETPRRAAVSSFGVGGTNAHAVLEEAPARKESGSSGPVQLLTLSAKTEKALAEATANLARHLRNHPELSLPDAAYTLQVGRRRFSHRRVVVCRDREEAIDTLQSLTPGKTFTARDDSDERPAVFMFSGQGSQYVNMGRELYETERVFRDQMDTCAEHLKPHLGYDLRELLYPSEDKAAAASERINQTDATQPALFAIEYALAGLWMAWGIEPQGMIGHSIGEYVAACLAGVFTLEEALELVAARGRLMQSQPAGAMMAILLPEEQVLPLLAQHSALGTQHSALSTQHSNVTIATINAPSACVVSGPSEEIAALERQLEAKEIPCSRLYTSHAFHSAMMDPILKPFAELVGKCNLRPPRIPFISNVTGTWITEAEATDPNYWARHLRQPVRFEAGVRELLREPHRAFLEIGPGNTLCSFVRLQPGTQVVLSSLRHPKEPLSDLTFLLAALGRFWIAGGRVDWNGFYQDEVRYRVSLPTYPFQRERFWITPTMGAAPIPSGLSDGSDQPIGSRLAPAVEAEQTLSSLHARPQISTDYAAPRNALEKNLVHIWEEILGIAPIGVHDNFFELGGHSLLATRMLARLRQAFKMNLPLRGIVENPTVASLADRFQSDDLTETYEYKPKDSIWTSLIPMQPLGTHTPFFLVAGAHADEDQFVRYLSNMIPHLGLDQPVYGFKPRGLDGIEEPHGSVEEMARDYVKELLEFQPEGPYLIVGECVGGIVAYEMGQVLHERGKEVGLLFLMDTPRPTATIYIRYKLGLLIKRFVKALGYLYDIARLDFRAVTPMLRRKRRRLLPLSPEERIQKRVRNNELQYITTLSRYRARPYPGKLTFLVSEEEMVHSIHTADQWKNLPMNGMEVHTVPGTHITRLTVYGKVTAGRLTDCLHKAQDHRSADLETADSAAQSPPILEAQ